MQRAALFEEYQGLRSDVRNLGQQIGDTQRRLQQLSADLENGAFRVNPQQAVSVVERDGLPKLDQPFLLPAEVRIARSQQSWWNLAPLSIYT